MFVYASFTASEMSCRWSSTSSTATSASFRAASVAARFLPKSKRSWESTTCAMKVSENPLRSEEHTSELQSHSDLVCRLLLEKKKKKQIRRTKNNNNSK